MAVGKRLGNKEVDQRMPSIRDQAARRAGYGSWTQFIRSVRNAAACEDVAVRWGGLSVKQAGQGWLACCPFHADATPSLSLNGRVFYCHGAGCDAQGDVIDLAMRLANAGFTETLLALAEEAGLAVPDIPGGRNPALTRRTAPQPAALRRAPRGSAAEWPIRPPPEAAPLPENGRLILYSPRLGRAITFRADAWYEYRDLDGRLLGLTARVDYGLNRKAVLPATWRRCPSTGRCGWVLKGWSGLRPVYGIHRLSGSGRPSILVVEGEKTVDAAQRLLGPAGWTALSPSGGGKAAARADWSPLRSIAGGCRGRTPIAFWPDADRKQGEGRLPAALAAERVLDGMIECFGGVEALLRKFNCRVVLPHEGLPHGWDLADAEAGGWDTGRAVRALAGSRHWDGRPGWDAGS